MDLDVLAALAGNTLVTVAVTDTFETVRHKVARLFGQGKPAAAIERRLDETRQQLIAADPDEAETIRASLAGQWHVRFADLLTDYPEAAAEVSALVRELQARVSVNGTVTNTVTGSVIRGPVIMGRDFGDVTINPVENR